MYIIYLYFDYNLYLLIITKYLLFIITYTFMFFMYMYMISSHQKASIIKFEGGF